MDHFRQRRRWSAESRCIGTGLPRSGYRPPPRPHYIAPMGSFRVPIEIGALSADRLEPIEALVDTGADGKA